MIIGSYKNGNYTTTIYDDGTKIRETIVDSDTSFLPEFPECMDIKLTNRCDLSCGMCHEDSVPDGEHGDILNPTFWDTLRPHTEVALGGGNLLSHPHLMPLLTKLKHKKIIANITVNQTHFVKHYKVIELLSKTELVKGIGVSVTKSTKEFIELVKSIPNIVLHVINGVIKYEDMEMLFGHNLKVLILGYKMIRRGGDFHSPDVERNKKIISDNIVNIIKNFKIVSFDNLALEQLQIKNILSKETWDRFYMGDDGKFTMYIDLVKQEFARSSISQKRYKLLDNIDDMFKVITNE